MAADFANSAHAHAASQVSGDAGLRATIGGGLTLFGGGASHWVDWVSQGMSLMLSLIGLCAVLYGVYRQRQQRAEEVARAAREVEAHRMLREKHEAEMARLKRSDGHHWPEV